MNKANNQGGAWRTKSCGFNAQVECRHAGSDACKKCGWNPEVKRRRLAKRGRRGRL